MTYQDLISEIKQLPLNERLRLLEAITRSVRDEVAPPTRRGSSVNRVRGMIKPTGPLPSGDELKDAYTRYLIEKYT